MSQNKPFACIECPSRFTRDDNMRKHMSQSHGWSDPVICKEAVPNTDSKWGLFFEDKVALTRHKIWDHHIEVILCRRCHTSFASIRSLATLKSRVPCEPASNEKRAAMEELLKKPEETGQSNANSQEGEDEGSGRETENSSEEDSNESTDNSDSQSENEANDENAKESYASEPRNAVSMARDPNLSESEVEGSDDEGSGNDDDKGPTSSPPQAQPRPSPPPESQENEQEGSSEGSDDEGSEIPPSPLPQNPSSPNPSSQSQQSEGEDENKRRRRRGQK